MAQPWEMDWGAPEAPAAKPWEMDWGAESSKAQTPSARIAEDFASLPPSRFGESMREREVSPVGAPGSNWKTPFTHAADITQRARNTAFGTGPGSVQVEGVGVPGVALPAAGALAAGYRALPSEWREKIRTGVVTAGMEGAAQAAKTVGAPDAVVEWLKTAALVRMFGRK